MTPLEVRLSPHLETAGLQFWIAHLSDLHLHVPGRAGRSHAPPSWTDASDVPFHRALAEIAALPRRPDLLVLTGDLTDTADPAEFAMLADALRGFPVPTLAIPGNHDAPGNAAPGRGWRDCYEAFRAPDWPAHPASDEFAFRIERNGWEFVGIDTSRYQRMSEAHRAEVRRMLAASDAPCVVLTHSPLLAVGNFVDAMSFHDRRLVEDLLAAKRVKAVLSGHVHASRAWLYHGTVHVTATSLSYGVGGGIGYGFAGFGDDRLLFALRRELPGHPRDLYRQDRERQEGALVPLPFERFEDSPLCNPSIWPWRADPRERG